MCIRDRATDYSDFICHTWEYCYDTYRPQPVKIPFSPEEIKGVLSNYFVESFVAVSYTHLDVYKRQLRGGPSM